MTTVQIKRSKKELYELAKNKAANLLNNTQIRLIADLDCNYWIFKKDNINYIGYLVEEKMPKFFMNRSLYEMINKEGKTIGFLQKLL